MSLKLLAIFTLTEIFLCMTPGPAVLLIVSQAMKSGFKSSLRGTLGILTGNTLYFALSALGLGALLIASSTLFQIIKWIGAAYLIFIGLKMLLAKGSHQTVDQETLTRKRSVKLFSHGLITQMSNPKAIVFFSALLPQFVTPGDRMIEQFIILGIISIAVELPVLLIYGWIAERGGKLILGGKFSALPDRIAGAFLVGAGVSLAAVRKL
jgi:threonine/homoserine/homoserine lactone efflux protein